MNFVFPTANAASLPVIDIPRDVAIVAFYQATDAGMFLAKESYQASFPANESISALVLAKWIKAYYERK